MHVGVGRNADAVSPAWPGHPYRNHLCNRGANGLIRSFFCLYLSVCLQQQIGFDKTIKITIEHGLWLSDFMASPKIFHHLVGLQNIAANLRAKVNFALIAGDRIGLGTDGALGGEPDMFAVMRLFHSVQVADTGELSLRPREVLELATLGGARALGWAAETGSLAVGKRADLVLLDGADFPALGLGEDPTAWLLYGAGREDVRTVWVDGVPRVHEAELVEGSLDALRDRARATIAAVHHTGTE